VKELVADARELEDTRFAEIVRYAQTVLGGQASGRASQRDLANALGIAPTMVTRYKSRNCDWRGLRASTIEALAKAARLEVGTVFVWLHEGREAAMAYERRMSAEPRAFRPVDLARELTAMLEQQDDEAGPDVTEPAGLDYAAIAALLRPLQGPAFERLVEVLEATTAVNAIAECMPLEDEDWLKLARLLSEDPAAFRQRYSAKCAARTQRQAA
jgi:transcriptional regulator with XRE-family HTH domain